jgi:hypothetical protein
MAERVVFDTNIWISGLLWRGKPYQCLLLARAKIVQHVYCREMIAELSQKLRQVYRIRCAFCLTHLSERCAELDGLTRDELACILDTFASASLSTSPIVRRKDEE